MRGNPAVWEEALTLKCSNALWDRPSVLEKLLNSLPRTGSHTLLLTDVVLTWGGILGNFKGVEGGSQARAIGEHANPLPRQLLRRVPVRGGARKLS